MSKSELCRCPSCGYVHNHEEHTPDYVKPEPVPALVVVVPDVAVPQAIRCPLCGCGFTDAEVYTAHRAADCKTPSTVDSGLPDSPDPLDLSHIPVAPIVDPADVTTIAPEPAPAEDTPDAS